MGDWLDSLPPHSRDVELAHRAVMLARRGQIAAAQRLVRELLERPELAAGVRNAVERLVELMHHK